MKPLVSLFVFCCIAVLLTNQVTAKSPRTTNKHEATCSLHTDPTTTTPQPCMMSLYSLWHTFTFSKAPVVIIESTLCSPLSQPLDLQQPTVAIVSRGDCAFDAKTQHATEAGFAALIIVNSESDPFLFGDPKSKQADGIPTLMVGNKFWDGDERLQACRSRQECPELFMDLFYGNFIL